VQGQIHSLAKEGLLQVSLSRLKGSSLFPCWIQHCALCAEEKTAFSEIYYQDKSIKLNLLSRQQAMDYVRDMIECFERGQQQVQLFFVDSAYEYVNSLNKHGEQAAREILHGLWTGDDFMPLYETQDPYIRTALKNVEEWQQQFYPLAQSLMGPAMDSMELLK
jgi:exonuclease V gamma subunit